MLLELLHHQLFAIAFTCHIVPLNGVWISGRRDQGRRIAFENDTALELEGLPDHRKFNHQIEGQFNAFLSVRGPCRNGKSRSDGDSREEGMPAGLPETASGGLMDTCRLSSVFCNSEMEMDTWPGDQSGSRR